MAISLPTTSGPINHSDICGAKQSEQGLERADTPQQVTFFLMSRINEYLAFSVAMMPVTVEDFVKTVHDLIADRTQPLGLRLSSTNSFS